MVTEALKWFTENILYQSLFGSRAVFKGSCVQKKNITQVSDPRGITICLCDKEQSLETNTRTNTSPC